MNIRYKLTKQDLTTHNDFQWKLNEWIETSGKGNLCTSGWLHCYSNPLLAIILNPIHANISNPKLFEVEVEGECLGDKGLKEGWTRMRLVKELEVPEITLVQKVAFGILCALEVYKEEKFVEWANSWLSGKDRSKESADAAYVAAYASVAAYSASSYAAYAADAARDADYSAYAAAAAYDAAYDAAYAAYAATYAADAARAAYSSAAAYVADYDLIKIVDEAVEIK